MNKDWIFADHVDATTGSIRFTGGIYTVFLGSVGVYKDFPLTNERRGYVSFPTGSLPGNLSITAASLDVKTGLITTTGIVTVKMKVYAGQAWEGSDLDSTDYPIASLATLIDTFPASGSLFQNTTYTHTFTGGEFALINKDGNTDIGLLDSSLFLTAGNADVGIDLTRTKLFVTGRLPSPIYYNFGG